jgi:class 3 adenylate cyclase
VPATLVSEDDWWFPDDVQERKLVTALFCDYVGSTGLGERLDPEALRNVQASYFDRMGSVVQRFGGTLEKFIGDAVVAVFGVPLAHEDDAERAVRCGLAMRDALEGLNDSLRPRLGVELDVRIGIATGEALVSGGEDALATGDVMNTAARLEQGAAPGEILVARETMQLSRDVIAFGSSRLLEARGKREPLEAWAAERVAPRGGRVRAPLVGRERELQVLAGAVEEAIRSETTRRAVFRRLPRLSRRPGSARRLEPVQGLLEIPGGVRRARAWALERRRDQGHHVRLRRLAQQEPHLRGESFRRELAVVHELDSFARERDETVSQLAIVWTLANPAVQVAIVGSRKPAHAWRASARRASALSRSS